MIALTRIKSRFKLLNPLKVEFPFFCSLCYDCFFLCFLVCSFVLDVLCTGRWPLRGLIKYALFALRVWSSIVVILLKGKTVNFISSFRAHCAMCPLAGNIRHLLSLLGYRCKVILSCNFILVSPIQFSPHRAQVRTYMKNLLLQSMSCFTLKPR